MKTLISSLIALACCIGAASAAPVAQTASESIVQNCGYGH